MLMENNSIYLVICKHFAAIYGESEDSPQFNIYVGAGFPRPN